MSQSDGIAARIREDVGEGVEIHDSSTPDAVFVTTRSNIELALRKYKEGVLSKTKWVNPFVTFITVLSALAVADFNSMFEFSKNTWESVFIIILLISIIWLSKAAWAYREESYKSDIKFVINELESDN